MQTSSHIQYPYDVHRRAALPEGTFCAGIDAGVLGDAAAELARF